MRLVEAKKFVTGIVYPIRVTKCPSKQRQDIFVIWKVVFFRLQYMAGSVYVGVFSGGLQHSLISANWGREASSVYCYFISDLVN